MRYLGGFANPGMEKKFSSCKSRISNVLASISTSPHKRVSSSAEMPTLNPSTPDLSSDDDSDCWNAEKAWPLYPSFFPSCHYVIPELDDPTSTVREDRRGT